MNTIQITRTSEIIEIPDYKIVIMNQSNERAYSPMYEPNI